ncbi:MAG: pseudouridine synthase [Alloprevotella sp.]|nr:pseudouridine synthase [Alloprevotella sp.]
MSEHFERSPYSHRGDNHQREERGEGTGEFRRSRTPRPRFQRAQNGGDSRFSYRSDAQGSNYRRPSRYDQYKGDNNNRQRYGGRQDNLEEGNRRRGFSGRPQSDYSKPQRFAFGNQRFESRNHNQAERSPYRSGQQAYQRRQQTPYDPNAKYSMRKRIIYKEKNIDPTAPLRLNKFLANAGICSRRDADKYIEAGVVSVNGQIVTELGTKVLRTDTVLFHNEPVRIEHKVYILLNKPKGYVTTSDDPQNRKTVMDLVKNACPERIYPVGRLDRNTTGVLLLTNDGELADKLTHPQYQKKKIYHVFLDKNVTVADMRAIAEGIQLEDGMIKADDIQYTSDTDKKQVGIEIHSGRNRIVRRIFESLGYHVTKLDRVFFAGLTKKRLPRGAWRFLTEEEVNFLRMGSFE